MTTVIDGTTGTSIAGSSTVVGDLTVNGVIQAGGVATSIYPIVSGTAVTVSGTAVDFTGIPSWVKRITVMFSGVSTNGASLVQVQLGTSGGVQTTGYRSTATYQQNAGAIVGAASTTGFAVVGAMAASVVFQGSVTFMLHSSNLWVASGTNARSDVVTTNVCGGDVTLSAALDRVRITTVNGTDTFDAGTINILYE
jgi:hypothetical protein